MSWGKLNDWNMKQRLKLQIRPELNKSVCKCSKGIIFVFPSLHCISFYMHETHKCCQSTPTSQVLVGFLIYKGRCPFIALPPHSHFWDWEWGLANFHSNSLLIIMQQQWMVKLFYIQDHKSMVRYWRTWRFKKTADSDTCIMSSSPSHTSPMPSSWTAGRRLD